MNSIIKAAELRHLLQQEKFILVDARSGPDVKERYAASHIAGAVHVDLDTDLAEKTSNAANGGRHPLPSPAQFSKVLEKLGISPESHVVIYDDKNGAIAAARFWWMLRAAGHQNVQVLDGGMQAAIDAGFPVDSNTVTVKPATYLVDTWSLPHADIDIVESAAKDKNFVVIDVRDPERYSGEKETIDTVAGHIPGAVNIPFAGNLDQDGFFLSALALKEKYKKALEGHSAKQVIVHCGSGVTACHTLLAMDQAGLEIPSLYVGSWSEWSRNGKEIATSGK